MRRQIVGHEIHVVGQIFPNAGNAFHLCLTAEFPFGSDLARHASHFRRKRVKLIHHRIDRILEFKNLTLNVDRNLLGQVAIRHGRRNLGDVSNLACEVACHKVHAVRQILPGAPNPANIRLSAEFAFRANLSRNPGHLRRKCV